MTIMRHNGYGVEVHGLDIDNVDRAMEALNEFARVTAQRDALREACEMMAAEPYFGRRCPVIMQVVKDALALCREGGADGK